jgi:hypothetical protein
VAVYIGPAVAPETTYGYAADLSAALARIARTDR